MSRFYQLPLFIFILLFSVKIQAENFISVNDDPWWSESKGDLSVDTGGRSRFVPVDFDGDGDLDLVSGDETGALHFFENQGAFNFIEVKDYFSYIDYTGVTSPSFYDNDSDGTYEIMALGVEGTIYLYRLNSVSGNYEVDSSYTFTVSSGFQLVPYLVDWDGDGTMDMLVGQKTTDAINLYSYNSSGGWVFRSTLLNTGEGTGGSRKILNVPFAFDFDSDGDFDIFLGKNDGTVHYYENQNDGSGADTFIEDTSIFTTPLDLGDITAASLGDMTGDGVPDLIVGSQEGHLSVFQNTSGVFGATDLVDNGSIEVGNRSVAFATKSGDELTLLIGNQNGTVDLFTYDISSALLTSSTENYLGFDFGECSSVKIGDLTSSSGDEFAAGNKEGTVFIVSEDGTTTTTLSDVGDFATPFPYDIDGDGDMDLISGERAGGLVILTNNGDGTFESPVDFLSIDVGFRAVPALGDIDNDGDDDILIGDKSGTLTLLRNNGSATMIDDANYDVETNFASIDVWEYSAPTLIDANSDGAMDMIIGSTYGRLYLFLQDADSDGFVGDEDCNSNDPLTFTGATEACDGVDNNCDGTIDGATVCSSEDGFCGDGADNDGDGFLDSEDSDCGGLETSCSDEADNDGDGDVDCSDIDCASETSCLPAVEDCTNGIDDNTNGLVDCDDSECSSEPACGSTTTGGSDTAGETSGGDTSSGDSTGSSSTTGEPGPDPSEGTGGGSTTTEDASPDESEDPSGYSLIRGTGCSLNFD